MKIRISNMLRVERAEIELAPGQITTVTGRNAAGKTSLATITGALLCGDGNPAGASKGQGQVYLKDGTDAGVAELLDDNGDVTVRWLAQSSEIAVLNPPQCSQATVGLVDFCGQMSPAARVKLWEGYFLPPPKVLEARIREALAPYVNANLLDTLMESARDDDGYDAIVKAYRTRIQDAKRSWTRIAGATWGVRKGADWLPEGWIADLDGTTLEAAQNVVEAARAEVRDAQVEHAVDATIIAQATEAASSVPVLQAALNVAERAHADAVLAAQEATNANRPELDALERTVQEVRDLQRECERLTRELDALHRDKPEVPEADVQLDNNATLAQAAKIERLRNAKPDASMFRSGLGVRVEELKRLKANPPVLAPLPQGIPCPYCARDVLVLDEDVLVTYDVDAAETANREVLAEALRVHQGEIDRIQGEIDERIAESEKECGLAMVRWQDGLDEAEQALADMRIAIRRELDEAVEQWMTTTAARQTELEEARARHATAFDALGARRAGQAQFEERFKPLHEDVLATKEAKDAARIALETQKRLAGQADGKVARTDEMLERQAATERELERAMKHERLVKERFDAREQHENIVAYQTIVDVLGPRGVRAQSVEEQMRRFDTALGTIARVTGWPRVALDRHYAVSIGERKILRLCAESERLRAQWCLQIALARTLREPVVVLDAADHLDVENMSGLARLLDALCQRPNPPAFVVCGTELDTQVIAPRGRVYKLDAGITTEMGT